MRTSGAMLSAGCVCLSSWSTDQVVHDDVGLRRAELADVDRLAGERLGHRRVAGARSFVALATSSPVGVLEGRAADRVRVAVGRDAQLELRRRPR